jgi:phage-related protein
MFHVEHCGKAQIRDGQVADSSLGISARVDEKGVRLWEKRLFSRTLDVYQSGLDLAARLCEALPDRFFIASQWMYFIWYTVAWGTGMAQAQTPQKIPLVFFRTNRGREPVREWLKGLEPTARLAIGKDLLRAQWRWPVGMPLCRSLGKGLWEVRTDVPANRSARVLLCFYQEHLVALHGFIKKTRATPVEDLALARKRQTEIEL